MLSVGNKVKVKIQFVSSDLPGEAASNSSKQKKTGNEEKKHIISSSLSLSWFLRYLLCARGND